VIVHRSPFGGELRRLREKAGVQTRTTVVLSIPFEGRPAVPAATPDPASD